MAEFMKMLLSLSFSGTVLFFLVLIMTRLFKTRLSRRWQYYIWLAVVLRFLIPFAPSGNVTNVLFHSVDRVWQNSVAIADTLAEDIAGDAVIGTNIAEDAAIGTTIAGDAVGEVETAAGDEDVVTDRESDAGKDAIAGTDKGTAVSMSESTPRPIIHSDISTEVRKSYISVIAGCLFFLWTATALFMFLYKIAAYRRYLRYLTGGNTEVTEAELLNLLEESKEQRRIRRNIRLYRNPDLVSPIMTGFLKPCIILPETLLAEREARYIFAHELVHYQYKDMFYKWLVQITICLHWFNPAVYFLAKRVNENCELACDEKVIKTLDRQERKAYGDALLSFMKTQRCYENPSASFTMSEGAEQLIERLGAIMDYQKKTKKGILFAGILTVVVCFGFMALGAYIGVRAGSTGVLPQDVADDSETGSAPNRIADENRTENAPMKSVKAENEKLKEDYRIVSEENVYYILTEDTDLDDIPTGSETKGFIGIVLVRKSGYTSMGPFLNIDFRNAVERECERCLEKEYISEKEKSIILEAAEEIEDSKFGAFTGEDFIREVEMKEDEAVEDEWDDKWDENTKVTYCQRSFYVEPYVIELGWNLSDKIWKHTGLKSYPEEFVTLTDGSNMTVYFQEKLKEDMMNEDVLAAVAGAIDLAKKGVEEERRTSYGMDLPDVEAPHIINILYVPRDEINDFAEDAWKKNDITQLCYIVDALTDEVKLDYLERAYEENRIDFFSIIYDELPQEEVDNFGRRFYEDDRVDFFSMICDDMSEETKLELRKRAWQEEKYDYYYIIDDDF